MAKYLLKVNYTLEGVRGVLAGGGSARRKAAEAAVKSAGGSIEAFYFAFGSTDAYVICEIPDNATAAALALAVTSGGGVRAETVPLLTPEDIDKAAKVSVDYRPPGT